MAPSGAQMILLGSPRRNKIKCLTDLRTFAKKGKLKMLKKLLTYSVVVTTMVWSVGLLAMPLGVSAAAVSGDLIKLQCAAGSAATDSCRAVYYLGANSKRYVFPNEKTYKTWYSDFSGVKIVSATELASYAIGGNVTYKPGAKLVKVTTDSTVYAVAANGTLRKISSEAVAKALYGDAWGTQVQDIPDAFWVNYTPGADITVAGDYDKAAVLAAATSINVDKNLSGGAVSTGTSLTVSLASDTPASGIAVEAAARVPFTKINLTASADGDIVIDAWQVIRTGLGADGAFSSIDLVDASTMSAINETGKTFSSDHTANFTEDFTIPAGTTKTVIIAANMATVLDTYAGQVPQLGLNSITLKGGTVVGTLPVVGNYQTINATIVLGSATVKRGAYSNATSTLEVGKLAYTFLSFQVEAGSGEDVQFSQVKIYNDGSSAWDDMDNLKLYRDGTELSSTPVISGSYATFNVSPITISKGQTAQFQVKADIAGGSGRTIILGVYRTTDLLVKGLVYGYNITPTYSGSGTQATNPVLWDNTQTIGPGTLRVSSSATVAAGNVAVGSDQVLGAFEIEAKGEAIDVSALTLAFTSTGAAVIEDALKSVKLVDSTGKTVAGPTDVTDGSTNVAFTDTFTVPAGTNVYKVVGTLATNGAWATNETIYASINTPATKITARGQVSSQSITATPTGIINANTQTVKAANITVTKDSVPTTGNVIKASSGVLVGSWTFDATNSGEDVRITALAIRASTTGKTNNLTLKDASTILYPINTSPTVTTINVPATSTFALSQPLIITKGTSKTIKLYSDIGSDSAAGEVIRFGISSGAAVTAYGVTTGNTATVTATANDGAILTIQNAGTLTITADSTAAAPSLVVAGTTGVALADIRLKATNEPVDVTKLVVEVADGGISGATGDYTQITKLYLKLDGTVVGDASGYSLGAATKTIYLERGAFTIPEGTVGKKLSLVADLVQIGTNQPGTANGDIKVGLGFATGAIDMTAYGNMSNGAATKTYVSATGSAVIIHKSVPQVVVVTPTEALSAAAVLHRVNITAVGGAIGIYRLSYAVSSSTSLDGTNYYLTLNTCSACGGISNGTVLTAEVANETPIATGIGTVTLPISSTAAGKDYLTIAQGATATLDLKATVAGQTSAATDSFTTSLLGDTATTSGDTGGSVAAAYGVMNQGDFVWSDLNLADDATTGGTGKTSKQWYNGYYVAGLGAVATTTGVTVHD